MPDTLRHAAATSPEKTAVVCDQDRLTFATLFNQSLRLANALRQRGVKRGDRVGVFLDNSCQSAVAIYGILLADAVFVVINPQTRAEKLAYVLNDCGARALIVHSHLYRTFIQAPAPVRALETVFVVGKVQEAADPRGVSFDEALDAAEPANLPSRNVNLDLCSLIYTSGSTGEPKGVMHTHLSMLFAISSLVTYLRLDQGDRVLCALPLAFDYGLYQLLMTVHLGATVVLERSFAYPAKVFNLMERENITVFPGVPTMFAMMRTAHRRQSLRFDMVTRVTNTAAALPASFHHDLREIFPHALIYRMYGLTECKRVSYLEPELLEAKPESVGKAIPGTETLILDETGSTVRPGEPGILHVRGAHVMRGYWNKKEETAKMLKQGIFPGEYILCTHDYFTVDNEGYLYFIGRSDDIIKSRGEKVSPLEVERVLYGLADVYEAAVIGVPDPVLGQAVIAFISPREGASHSATHFRKWCCANLENFMQPHEIIILDTLPHSKNGKIDKKQLAAEHFRHSQRKEAPA